MSTTPSLSDASIPPTRATNETTQNNLKMPPPQSPPTAQTPSEDSPAISQVSPERLPMAPLLEMMESGTPIQHTPATPARASKLPRGSHSELTPVIRNSNLVFMEGMSTGRGGGVHMPFPSRPSVVTPGRMGLGLDLMDSDDDGDFLGLQHRRSPFPPPRTRLPPKKRSSAGADFGDISRVLASTSPSPEVSGAGAKVSRTAGTRIAGGITRGPLAPIELTPDRKHFSFSGPSQYERSLASVVTRMRLAGEEEEEEFNVAAAASPFRSPGRFKIPSHAREPSSPAGKTQYQPKREAHGVTEIADKRELDAIFKRGGDEDESMSDSDADVDFAMVNANLRQPIPMDERQWSIPSIRLANRLDSSSLRDSLTANSLASFQTLSDEDTLTDGGTTDGGTISFEDTLDDDQDDLDLSLHSKGSYDPIVTNRGQGQGEFRSREIAPAQGVAGVDPDATNADASASLEDALGRISIVEMRLSSGFAIEDSISTANTTESKAAAATDPGPTTTPDRHLYSWAPPPSLCAPPPPAASTAAVGSPAISSTMDDHSVEYCGPRRRRAERRRRRRGRRRANSHVEVSSTVSAMDWLQGLQNRPANETMITEAASSRFLIGGGTSGADTSGEGLGFGVHGGAEESEAAAAEAVRMNLGMPHALCRSSTITGQYVAGREDRFSIALTSSGSS